MSDAAAWLRTASIGRPTNVSFMILDAIPKVEEEREKYRRTNKLRHSVDERYRTSDNGQMPNECVEDGFFKE